MYLDLYQRYQNKMKENNDFPGTVWHPYPLTRYISPLKYTITYLFITMRATQPHNPTTHAAMFPSCPFMFRS